MRSFVPGRLTRALGLLAGCVGLTVAAVGPASAAGGPLSPPYTGLESCPLDSPELGNTTNLQVGCVTSTTSGGTFSIGDTTVKLGTPIKLKFGVYWDSSGPGAELPDGGSANLYHTVAPSSGNLLDSPATEVTIPGIWNVIPGITSVKAQVEQAGPLTEFAPLAAGTTVPVFRLPIKLHLIHPLLGPRCYLGSDSTPIVLRPAALDAGTVDVQADPNGHQTLIASFSKASLKDTSFSVPGAKGCGVLGLGALDPVINGLFKLPSAAGKNSVTFAPTDTGFAFNDSVKDLKDSFDAARG
ncbi:hypothetical protein [Streptomyces tsukubensis]|uniref:Secreted protein n=1 Tax=Streptomyces tsukubensis TaxID=83656 RepID=A0A1V4AGK3_9ACTN|nr:hypothetical protein [Streptomyces tsukubensis]OON82805.1 hypothetical protein B1H18_01855 [Streptomyces tsukubensis]QFR92019.1 hypothetical protein GBW32_01830 [Streptomyces tsukubensis]